MQVKFNSNLMLFTIRFINLYFILQNLKFKHLIDDINMNL